MAGGGCKRNPNAETRNPQEGRSSKAEVRSNPNESQSHRALCRGGNGLNRSAAACQLHFSKGLRSRATARLLRISDFGFPSVFGLRVSDFNRPALTHSRRCETSALWGCTRPPRPVILWPVGK